jgi:hypothetical protein
MGSRWGVVVRMPMTCLPCGSVCPLKTQKGSQELLLTWAILSLEETPQRNK